MKTTFNLTTDSYDLARFASTDELLELLKPFDGIELMYCGDDELGIIPKPAVVGLHMRAYPYWVDFWHGNEAALIAEFGSLDVCEAYYGGSDRRALIDGLKEDLEIARRYGAEYVVFHIADASIAESFTREFHLTPEQVIDASLELLEILFEGEPPVTLLLENLWYPGLTFTQPALTERLLSGITHKDAGIMLDTGHLLHTNSDLRAQADAVAYIHRMLDNHGALSERIRGVHLNQSLTGSLAKQVQTSPPVLASTHAERVSQLYDYIFKLDLHRPFTAPGIRELIARIAPEYLTFEFITDDLAQHKRFLNEQLQAFAGETEC